MELHKYQETHNAQENYVAFSSLILYSFSCAKCQIRSCHTDFQLNRLSKIHRSHSTKYRSPFKESNPDLISWLPDIVKGTEHSMICTCLRNWATSMLHVCTGLYCSGLDFHYRHSPDSLARGWITNTSSIQRSMYMDCFGFSIIIRFSIWSVAKICSLSCIVQ